MAQGVESWAAGIKDFEYIAHVCDMCEGGCCVLSTIFEQKAACYVHAPDARVG